LFINNLYQEKTLLQKIQKTHLEKMYTPDNPSGILVCQKKDNDYRWLIKDLHDGRLVTSPLRKTDKQLAEKLAVNLYRIICIQHLQIQIDTINSTIRCLESGKQSKFPLDNILPNHPFKDLLNNFRRRPQSPADFFDLNSPYRQFILSHLQSEYSWVIEWYLNPYKKNPDHPEQLIFPVKLGFKVRSKSEVLIADRLYEEGILYHYEEQLILSDHSSYPDFNIPITLYRKYAWEHFGAMDKPLYFNRTRGRIMDYLDHQWLPGINMLTTYETKQNPLTEEQVDHVISWIESRYRLAFPDIPPDKSFNMYDLAAYVKSQRGSQ